MGGRWDVVAWRWILGLLATIAFAFGCEVDTCLDRGGRWNDVAGECEFDDSICPRIPGHFEAELAGAGDRTVLAVFWAPWSGPDRLLLETLEAEIGQDADRWLIRRVNVDEEVELAESCLVRSIPTVIPFRSGRPVGRLVGAVSSEELRLFLGEGSSD